MGSIIIDNIGERKIAVGGVGKLFYQDGFPISMAVSELNKQGIEVSMFHLIEELWENGWSWKTIEIKLRGEMELDIDKSMSLNFTKLKKFYFCLEQPNRANGGYEESRSIIFEYLFGMSKKEEMAQWVKEKILSR